MEDARGKLRLVIRILKRSLQHKINQQWIAFVDLIKRNPFPPADVAHPLQKLGRDDGI